jgi:hypothetical protein
MHRFEREVEALPLAAGVGPHRPMTEGVDIIRLDKLRQARVAIAMRQRAKRIEEAERLATGHLRIERSLPPRVADLRAKTCTVATGIKSQNLGIARVGGDDPIEDLEERALTGAIGADERDERARRNGEPDSIERPDPRAKGLHKPLDADGRHSYRWSRLSRRRRWCQRVPL